MLSPEQSKYLSRTCPAVLEFEEQVAKKRRIDPEACLFKRFCSKEVLASQQVLVVTFLMGKLLRNMF